MTTILPLKIRYSIVMIVLAEVVGTFPHRIIIQIIAYHVMCANGYTLYQTHPLHRVNNSTYVYLTTPST